MVRMPRRIRLVGGLAAVVITATPLVAGAGPATATPIAAHSTGLARPGHLDPGLPTTGSQAVRVVVSARPGAVTAAAQAARALGAHLGAALPIIDGFAATVAANRLTALAAQRSVIAITADRSAKLDDRTFDASKTASAFVRSTGADAAWNTNNYGAGVGVAVLDTGVSDVNDLAGRVIHGPDLSGEGTSVDTFGHGTVMGGLIAGNGADSGALSLIRKGGYTGVAPRANVIAVKVAGRNAAVDVSTVLQAMHWVAAYRNQYNIRVLNLSWGVPSTQDSNVDPLNYAVERLWRLGIVVVVAAGNAGPTSGTIRKPGDDPLVITVGAFDDNGTGSLSDDSIADWSSRGPTAAGLTKPDVVAPGRLLVATRSYGSFIESSFPTAWIGLSYIRGSGTSEATAVVSGDIALLLAARPQLTPDQVKYLLKTTAIPLPGLSPNDQGAGRVRIDGALSTGAYRAPVQQSTATGLGSIEESRGGLHVSSVCNDVATTIVGEMDVRCEPWDGTTWTGTTWTGDAWTGTTWTSDAWTGTTWTGTTWTGGTWSGGAWGGAAPWARPTTSSPTRTGDASAGPPPDGPTPDRPTSAGP